MDKSQIERYARHLVLKEVGGAGQASLLEAKVAIVGAGGLGGPASLYLAAAGVGQMTIIDDDVIDRSNLQRQIQFSPQDVGAGKAQNLCDTLMAQNADVSAVSQQARLNADNASQLLKGHDLVLDGTDNFSARFAVNQACLDLGVPLISGALGRWNGQVSAFENNGQGGPCYQCLVPQAPPDAQTCSAVGVVGAIAGMIGGMMALEAIKIITGAGRPLYGGLFLYDALTVQSRRVSLQQDPECPACGS